MSEANAWQVVAILCSLGATWASWSAAKAHRAAADAWRHARLWSTVVAEYIAEHPDSRLNARVRALVSRIEAATAAGESWEPPPWVNEANDRLMGEPDA